MGRHWQWMLVLIWVGTEACADEREFRSLYADLVSINTTRSTGSCTAAAETIRAHLEAVGIPANQLQILAPAERPNDGSLIALLPGREREAKPILLLAHLDVVDVKPDGWATDPFRLTEKAGVFYARGSSDDKAMAAIFVDSLSRYVREGFRPRRGIKLALTCGEETPDVFNGVRWLLQTHAAELDAAFALNEGAFGELDAQEKPVALQIQAGEKVYQDFALETGDPGGHSARPTRRNAISRLGGALARLGAYKFPIQLNEATRGYLQAEIPLVMPAVAADVQAELNAPPDEAAADRLWDANPNFNSLLRTTCVATQIVGGQALNALPEHARANVNCRILPGVALADIKKELEGVVADPSIAVTLTGVTGMPAPMPPLTSRILEPARRVAAKIWPGVPVVPTMLTAATDGRFLNASGIPTYGLSGIFQGVEGSMAHGTNEHIRVNSLMNARRFLYEVINLYSQAGTDR